MDETNYFLYLKAHWLQIFRLLTEKAIDVLFVDFILKPSPDYDIYVIFPRPFRVNQLWNFHFFSAVFDHNYN